MNFPYIYELVSLDSLDIEDIGNCTLKCFNDFGDAYYFNSKTSLGWVTIKQVGPLSSNDFEQSYIYSYRYTKKEYNQKMLYTTIDKFINDPKKHITQVFIISEDEFYDKIHELPL